jgi:Protein of unknown function (DUF4064)
MNRKIEYILGIVGFSMDALVALMSGVFLLILHSGVDFLKDAIDPTEYGAFSDFFPVFINLLWIPILGCVISFILGLIAVVNIKKNPKVAGGFFIAATIISSWLFFSGFFFQSVLYLIAGIMCFVREPEDSAMQ